MAEELRLTLAALFQQKGRDRVAEKDFVYHVSMRLRWFEPGDAQKLLQAGLDVGLLAMRDGEVGPTFDPASVEVPIGFAPSRGVLKASAPQEDLLRSVLDTIATSSGETPRTILSEVNAVQDRLGCDIEVAAFVVARERGCDISRLLPRLDALLLSRVP